MPHSTRSAHGESALSPGLEASEEMPDHHSSDKDVGVEPPCEPPAVDDDHGMLYTVTDTPPFVACGLLGLQVGFLGGGESERLPDMPRLVWLLLRTPGEEGACLDP